MKKSLFVSMLLCLVLTALNVSAAEVKIGYLDLQKAINMSSSGISAKEQIAKKVSDYETQVTQRKDELQKAKEELDKQALLLSNEARAAKDRDFQQKVKDFQRFTKDIQEELQQIDADMTRKIVADIIKVTAEIGEKEKYTAIFEKNESSLIYADSAIDMTERVIKQYNAANK